MITNTHFYIRQELFAVICTFALIGIGSLITLARAMWKGERVIQIYTQNPKSDNKTKEKVTNK